MAIAHARPVVGTTAVDLVSSVPDRVGFSNPSGVARGIIVQNPAGGSTVYLGGPGVTSTSYGYALAAGADYANDLQPDDALFGVVASGSVTVNVLHTGV